MKGKLNVKIEDSTAKGYLPTQVNRRGMAVNVWCASCLFKEQTKKLRRRYCTKHRVEVRPDQVCKLWQMRF